MTPGAGLWEARALWASLRAAVGLLTRAVFWLSFATIVGNALAEAVRSEAWFDLVVSALLLPLVFLTWPFNEPTYALAWPWADGTTLVPVLAAGLLAYVLSVTVGGRKPVPTWGSD